VCLYAFKFKVHCGSAFEPGASRLIMIAPITAYHLRAFLL